MHHTRVIVHVHAVVIVDPVVIACDGFECAVDVEYLLGVVVVFVVEDVLHAHGHQVHQVGDEGHLERVDGGDHFGVARGSEADDRADDAAEFTRLEGQFLV